jgi:hypothetical protein
MRPALSALFSLLLLLAGPVHAQTGADCRQQADDGVRRVEREMGRQPPAKNDTEAQQRWAKTLHEQLQAVNRRYEDCRRTAERRSNPQAANKELACAEASHRQADELQKRYANRTLSPAEQTAWRNEERAILDARHACVVKAAKG